MLIYSTIGYISKVNCDSNLPDDWLNKQCCNNYFSISVYGRPTECCVRVSYSIDKCRYHCPVLEMGLGQFKFFLESLYTKQFDFQITVFYDLG